MNQRATIAEQETQILKIFDQGKSQSELDTLVETRMARTQQVKKALLKKAGLDNDVSLGFIILESHSNRSLSPLIFPVDMEKRR